MLDLNYLTPNRLECIIKLMRILTIVLIIAAIVFCGPAIPAGRDYTMWLKAHPQAIVADGKSDTIISAEVRDSNGRNVPDNTVVEFTASQGIIESSAGTVAGVARVRLQSSANVGTAMVSAVVIGSSAVAQTRVDFLAPGTEMFDESFISISSKKYLGYDMAGKIIDAAGGVEIHSRGIDISVEECQLDARKTVLRAKGRLGGSNIILKRGDKQLEASELYYDFISMSGVILTPAEDGARRMRFRGRDFFTQVDEDPDKNVTFDFTPVGPDTMFIKSRSIIVRPGEEIKFKRADFYLKGEKVLGVPLHVESLNGQQKGVAQVMSYGTDGLRLDVPFYYSISPNGTGALRLKHGSDAGWGLGSGNAPWQLDLDQEYNIGSSTDGAFTMDRITSSQWGAKWTQRHEFDNDAQLYTYLDFPSHQSLYGSADYSRSFDNYTFTMNMRGDRRSSSNVGYYTSACLQSRPKPTLGGAVSYAYSTKLNYNSRLDEDNSKVGSGLGLQLYGKPLRLGMNGNFNTSLSVSQNIGGSDSGMSLWGNASYYQNLGTIGQFSLNYNYAHGGSSGYSEQSISTDFSLTPSQKWQAYFNATYGLGDQSISAFGELSYLLMPTWRLHLLSNMQRYTGWDYSDVEIAIAKALGGHEAMLIWSQSQRRFRMEFSAARF